MTTEQTAALLFVYNADSGLFNTLTDIAHKAISPSTYTCKLCAITHGVFKEKSEWRQYIQGISCPVEFLHRDEFERQYPDVKVSYPAILERIGRDMTVMITPADINRCKNVDDLRNLVDRACFESQLSTDI